MKLPLLSIALLLSILSCTAGTLTIKNPTRIKDTYVASASELNDNAGPDAAITAGIGTNGGVIQVSRCFVRFDLAQIPAGATINSATVHLFTDSAISGNVTTGGSNALYISRVTQDWRDDVVTYATQPSFTSTDQVSVPATTSVSQNLSADVTALIQDIINAPGQNYGLRFGLQSEDSNMLYRSVHFYSIESADSTLWPELDITYTAPSATAADSGTVTIQQGSYIKTTYIATGPELNSNHGNSTVLTAGVGTNSGAAQISRSYVRFDLSQIPAGATIGSATVTLFTDINNGGGNVTTGGSNAGYFSPITGDWDDNLITWADNLPFSSMDQGAFAATTSAGQNIQADVTNLVQYFVNNPALNYGMCLSMQSEDTTMLYRAVHCFTVNADSSDTWPQLVVTYSVPTGINEAIPGLKMHLYPNPTMGSFAIESSYTGTLAVDVINTLGQTVKTFTVSEPVQNFNISDLSSGMYEVRLSNGEQVVKVMKVVKE